MSLPSSPGGDASSTIANDTRHLPNRPPREGVRGVGSHRLDEREEASIIYWLIVKHDGLGRRVFTTRLTGSEEVLPIFGHAEEAGEFLRLGKLENGWRVRGTGVGELVSVLLGLCANVRRVALDPMPETDADAGILASFVSMGRENFMEFLSSNLRLEK